MNVLELNNNNFEEEVLKSDKKVLVDFYATWCGPCKMMAPIIEEISEEMKGVVKAGKIDVDKNLSLAQQYDIMSIPTIIIFEKGNPIKTFIGFTDKNAIIKALNE